MPTQEELYSAKQERKEHKLAVKTKYLALPIEQVVNQLEKSIEVRKGLRDRIIDELRKCDRLYITDAVVPTKLFTFCRKLNKYPNELSDIRLVEAAKKYLNKTISFYPEV